MGIQRADHPAQRRATGTRTIVGLCAVVIIVGLAVTMLVVRLRDELTGAAEVARLRGDLTALAALEGRIEKGRTTALPDADGLLSDLRRDVVKAAEHFPELARSGSFVLAVADLYEQVFDAWADGRSPSQAILDDLDTLARGTDVYLLNTARGSQARADRVFNEGIATLAGATLLGTVLTIVAVRRLQRSARAMRLAALREESDRRVRTLIENAPDLVVLLDPHTRRATFASPSVRPLLGYEPDHFGELAISDLLHPDDLAAARRSFARAAEPGARGVNVSCRVRHADGTWRHFELSLSAPSDTSELTGVVVNGRDVTEKIELQRSLTHQASHDPLTGLSNRAAFVELLHSALSSEEAADTSVVFLDLDGFKEINDSLGHAVGDEVLMTIAARLVTLTRHRDQVARLGGDEFAIVTERDDAVSLGHRLLEVIALPIELATGAVHVGASIGVTHADDEATAEDMLRCADVAMYDAKARGRNRVSEFEPHMHEAVLGRVAMRSALDEALAHDEFRLVYQPEIDLRDGRLLGYEALIRWHRADGSIVPPNDFIPIAEASGQIVEIGRWVLRAALTQLAEWQREFASSHLTMAVNVSARQLEDESFVQTVAEELFLAEVPACSLTLELTETTLIHDVALASQRLAELHDIGVMIAIDDYGSGHASIGYLREFPVDIVKIDRSFVAALDDRPVEAEAYLRSITDLARALSMETVAEGIEHSDQLDRLRALQCGIGQGFHLARPLDPAAARAFLVERNGRLA